MLRDRSRGTELRLVESVRLYSGELWIHSNCFVFLMGLYSQKIAKEVLHPVVAMRSFVWYFSFLFFPVNKW